MNCIGLTKTYINEADSSTLERAVRLNILFPVSLARAAEKSGVRVIQLATDCVFSGKTGNFTEASVHDALDAYGKSRSLGEVRPENVLHLRCSLGGPELAGRKGLILIVGKCLGTWRYCFWNCKLWNTLFGRIKSGAGRLSNKI